MEAQFLELIGVQELSTSVALGVSGLPGLQHAVMDVDAAGGPLRVELHWPKSL